MTTHCTYPLYSSDEAAGRVNNDRLGRIMARIRQVARNLTPIASLKTKRFEPHHLNTGRPDLHFMSGVREIRQTDDVHTQWILEIAGQTREFDATITEQHPDERIAWKSDAGLAVLVGCTLLAAAALLGYTWWSWNSSAPRRAEDMADDYVLTHGG
ncbi:MAG: hypothetical protein ACREQ3_26580, partial [Candidatus Binatia bacterium]